MSERFDEIEAGPKNVPDGSDTKTEISNSRKRIRSTTEDFPVSEYGFFTLNGERYGTIHALSAHLGMSYSKIYKEIRKNDIKPTKGKTLSGLIGRYYPEQIFTVSCPEVKDPLIVNEHEAKTGSEKPNEESDVKSEISVERDDIGSIVEDSHGFFMLGGERYGTVKTWSAYLSIPEYKIEKKIREKRVKSTNRFRREPGKPPSGTVEKYYPEYIFKDFLLEKVIQENSVPIANEHGCFVRDGKVHGTLEYWVKHYNLEATTFGAQVKKLETRSVKGKTCDKKTALFYAEPDIHKILPRWYNSQKQLLQELYTGHRLPRVRIKKDSMLHRALKGDILLLIPTKYAGIYQWLQKEFHLAPPGPEQVLVLFKERGGVSVLFKSEIEEIR
jgi:hypothetical protein